MNSIDKINSIGWADWVIDNFEINYERISVRLCFYEEHVATIYCDNFIGFSFVGHWDESTIEYIKIEQKGEFIADSLQTVKRFYSGPPYILGGGIKKIDDTWYQLNIKLIDGNTIKIACRDFEIEVQ